MNTIIHNTKVPEMGKERKYKYNNSELVIRFGDLTEAHTDVIVCSDDNLLSAKGGTSKAIREACGDIIIHDVNKKKNAELGDVVITTAGNLHHKYLFHCITLRKTEEGKVIKEEDDNLVEYVIQHSISKCLRLLTALDMSSMALPCIGAGYAGYNFERVGRIMSEVISDFLLKTNKTYHIEIYLYGKRDDFDMMDYIAFFEQFALRVPTENDHFKVKPMELPKNGSLCNSEQKDVFISYSRNDQEITDIICQYLDKYGISYWIDRESIHHGNNFKVEQIGDIDKAIMAYKMARTLWEKVLDKKNIEYVRLLTNMGVAYKKKGDYNAAKNLYYEALDSLMSYPGYYKEAITLCNNLGNLYLVNDIDKALTMFQMAQKQQEKYFCDSAELAITCYNIAICKLRQKKSKDALEYAEKANQIATKIYGRKHPFSKNIQTLLEMIKSGQDAVN